MIWFLIFIAIILALGIRIYVCVQKSKEAGDTWDLKDKYAAHDFGE
jgi:preprotein translocase subunit SecG